MEMEDYLHLEKMFINAVNLEESEYVPVTPHFQSTFLAYIIGVPPSIWYRNSKLILDSNLKVLQKFPTIIVFPGLRPHSSSLVEPSALGCKVEWPEKGVPMPMPIIKDIRDIKKLQIPDFNKDGLGPMFLEHYRYIKDKVGDKYPIDNGQALGPLEMASYLRGITELLKDFYFNPDWIHELLDITAEVCIAWIKTQDETLGGLKKVFISEDTVGFIRPEFYKEFVFPYDRKVFKALPDRCIGIYHCGSNSTHILEMIPDTGAKVFYFGSDVDIAHIKKKIGGKICLMGNVHPLKLLLKGTPKDVEEECKRLIKIAGPGGGYILGTGEGINEGTPLNNIDAMIISSKKYGKYPIK